MSKISQAYLDVIVNDKELYDACDTEVKQQIWKDNQALFGDQVGPIFTQYIRQKEKILFDYENTSNLFFSNSPKVSR
jgi:negative elongation factor B